MTDFFKNIYNTKTEKYERMLSYEDYREKILRALEHIRPFSGLDMVELGAGTGRLTHLIAPLARSICAFDISLHMLSVTTVKMQTSGLQNWETAVADNRQLPVEDASTDIAFAGLSLGHSVGWHPDRWQQEIGLELAEMKRVLRAGGTIILFETLGTGRETPEPPTEGLAEFYPWLEVERGFASTWIRTNHQFDSPSQSANLTRFFFGDELANRILRDEMTILPECTGIWCAFADP